MGCQPSACPTHSSCRANRRQWPPNCTGACVQVRRTNDTERAGIGAPGWQQWRIVWQGWHPCGLQLSAYNSCIFPSWPVRPRNFVQRLRSSCSTNDTDKAGEVARGERGGGILRTWHEGWRARRSPIKFWKPGKAPPLPHNTPPCRTLV